MSATAIFTMADLERMPDDGIHRELLHGELIELLPPKHRHSKIGNKIFKPLSAYVEANNLGDIYVEAGYQVFRDERTWLEPDVSFLRRDRVVSTEEDG